MIVYLFVSSINGGVITNMYAQQKFALMIGISDYNNPREDPDKWLNISGANDIALLMPQLKSQKFEISSLIDKQATYKNIVKGLDVIAKSAKKEDIVFLHFSMHGQPVEDRNGDEEDGWDESLIPYDAKMAYKKGVYEGEKHLLDDTLKEYVDKIRYKIGARGMLYVVIDACHAGSSSRGDDNHVRGTNLGFSPSGKFFEVDRSKDENNYFCVSTEKGQSPVLYLEACRSYEKNREIWDESIGKWYGPLSYYISKVIKNHTIGRDTSWVNLVESAMKRDKKVRRQNMVKESSK